MTTPPRLPAPQTHHFPDLYARYTRLHSARSSSACLCCSSVASKRGNVNSVNKISWWPRRRSQYRHPYLRHYPLRRCLSRRRRSCHRHSRSRHSRSSPNRPAPRQVFPRRVLHWKRSGLYQRYRAIPRWCLISTPRHPYTITTHTAPLTRVLPHHGTVISS
jgi:hypothetical protein